MIIILYQMLGMLTIFTSHADGGMQCADYLTSCLKHKTSCGNRIIRKYCRITCLKCTPDPPVYKNCRDINTGCAIISGKGRCRGSKYNYEYSRRNCRLTCDFCRRPKNIGQCGVAALRPASEFQIAPLVLNSNIVVGEIAVNKGYFPWQAAIYYNNEFHCGGVLIKKRFLLSSAGCFKSAEGNLEKFKVILGEYDRNKEDGTEQYLDVKKIVLHKGFKSTEVHDDISLIEMSKDATLTDYISPICLPAEGENNRPDSICAVTGWSRMYNSGNASQILQEITVPIIEQTDCEKQYIFADRKATSKMICSGYAEDDSFQSTCLRDNGAPLSCKDDTGIWKLYGILMPTCHGLQSYNVFTKVSSYRSWIDKLILP